MNMSLQNKIFAIFILTNFIGIGLVGWYGYQSSSKAYIDSVYELSMQGTNALKIDLESELKHVTKDVKYLNEQYALQRYMIWRSMSVDKKSEHWKQVFSTALIDFLKTQKDYYKIRVIDLEGNEIVVATYKKDLNSVNLVPENGLQNKFKRNYFKVATKLKKWKFYVSDMNLNKEYGEITKPYIPVIRYATSIINANDEKIGVFVISIDANNILDIIKSKLARSKENKTSYFLVNKNGDYLYHKNKDKRWNADLKNGANFNNEHFNLNKYTKNRQDGAFSHNNKIYSFHIVYPLKENKDIYFYIISSVDRDLALAKLDDYRQIFILILLFIFIVSFFSIRFYLSRITTPLTRVSSQLKALSRGEIKKEDIEYKANDEVGEIVSSTAKVISAIETTINQANAVADGDFSKDIELLSKNDKLGLAITDMTKRLKEIADLAQSLSVGHYDVKVIIKSSDDKLGLALVNMVDYLEKITNLAESIASGDLDVKYKAQGADDRLGRAILNMIKYLRTILKQAKAISKDDFSNSIEAKSSRDELGIALVRMTDILRSTSVKNKEEIWFSDGLGEFSNKLSGISDKTQLAKEAISIICRYVDGSKGVVYALNKKKDSLNVIASFAYNSHNDIPSSFKLGEGVVGQVGLDKVAMILKNIEINEYDIQSSTVLVGPKEVYVFPLINDNELIGVVEIMCLDNFSKIQIDYMKKVSSVLASILNTANQNSQIKVLLDDSQKAYEELQVQSEELQESNVQMEEQQQQLTIQSQELKEKNDSLVSAKQEIDKRADELEKASKYKSEFLANMSHELRTPLNSIILLSKLLALNSDNNLDDDSVEKVSVINKAGNDLLLLINDILDLTKIESGKMDLDYSEVKTSELLDDVSGLFNAVAEDKNLEFIVVDHYKSILMTDKGKIAQVLNNLLSNAFKFTRNGGVTLDLSTIDNNLVIAVKDTGIGIPSDKIDTIFDAFKQVDGSISREFGGTGLGLSICKTIVELMNGYIIVESEYGKGTEFKIILPLDPDVKILQTQKNVEESIEKIEATVIEDVSILNIDEEVIDADVLKNKNILIVDDDSRNIFTLTSTLENYNAEVFSAFNGKEAIEVLQSSEHIDLILMDIMMPIMDGLKAIEEVKADDKFKDIPILAITAKIMHEDKQKCLDAGANDYLPKPLNYNALISMIKAWIK